MAAANLEYTLFDEIANRCYFKLSKLRLFHCLIKLLGKTVIIVYWHGAAKIDVRCRDESESFSLLPFC